MSWPMVKLYEVADFIRGITFKPEDVVPLGSEGCIACFRTKNVQADLDVSDVWAVSDSFVKKDEKFLEAGDIIMSTANSWNLVGKSCWVPALDYKATVGGFVSILRGRESLIDRRYLYHWINTEHSQANLRKCARQTTNISNLSIAQAENLEIPLPPLEEQKRIAGILDQADALRRLRARALEKLNTLGQAVFQEMFGTLYPMPKNVNHENVALFKTSIGSQIKLQRGYDITKKQAQDGNIKVISSGGFSFYHNKAISQSEGVILGRKGSVGKVHYVRDPYWPHDTTLFVNDFKNNIPIFVYYYFLLFPIRNFEESAANPSLNRNNLHPVETLWPSIDRQADFEKKINEIEARLSVLNKASSSADTLFASLQSAAFQGGL